MVKLGINGFGRIGRMVFRAAVENFANDIEVVGINDLLDPEYLAYMLKFDSVHGAFKGEVSVEGNTLVVNGKKIRLTAEMDPANLKWNEVGADVVVESTGLFLTDEKARKHIEAGAKKVSCQLLQRMQLQCSYTVLTTQHTLVRISSLTHLAQLTVLHLFLRFSMRSSVSYVVL